MMSLIQAFQAAALIPGVAMDGMAFLKMAGAISGQARLADELSNQFKLFQPLIEAKQMAQAAMEQKSKEGPPSA